MSASANTFELDLADIRFDDEPEESGDYADPAKYGIRVIRRGRDEYITIAGRILTCYGAPVDDDFGTAYRVSEDILRPLAHGTLCAASLEIHFENDLWPSWPGVFDAESAVDLYRVISRERKRTKARR